MLKRTIYISNPAYLKIKDDQLSVQEPSGTIKGSVPIEDIALLMIDHYQVTLSSQLMTRLHGCGASIIICDAQHLPFGISMPLYGHTEHSERVKHQIEASESLKKQLWKQTIIQKIKNQEVLLKLRDNPHEGMSNYWQSTLSGDITNTEGVAAQFYWKHLIDDFTRERYGSPENILLNFGYAILRSIMSRAIVGSGLLPVLGIHHRNKYNPYCLADDLMEPYRPFVDRLVVNYLDNHPLPSDLTKEIKTHLLQIATQDVTIDGLQRPLMMAMTITTASLFKCYKGMLRQLKYPCFE